MVAAKDLGSGNSLCDPLLIGMRRCKLMLVVITLPPFALLSSAQAAQYLIPSPYPSEVTGAEPLDAEPMLPGPQRIMREPYPQDTGLLSQGNPPLMRRHRRQRLVPSTYQRRYRVERHGR